VSSAVQSPKAVPKVCEKEPTDYRHFEIYTFTNGTATRDGTSGEGGIDFNYGGAPNLQLTATVPAAYNIPSLGPSALNLGNVELAAKYRFLTQQDFGLDVAIFPRVFLPSASPAVGERHASFLFPLWMEKDWGQWSAYGGGGCEINRGGNSENFCLMGAVVTRQITPSLQMGLEVFHQTPDTQGGLATTSLGVGLRYDLSDNFHLLGYLGRGVQNVAQTDQFNWYTSILFTF
jgi:Putative MetA-pathway of phenol degradation